MYFLTQEHFARAAEYAIYTVDVPCALGSAYLQFSVNSACSHGVCRTVLMAVQTLGTIGNVIQTHLILTSLDTNVSVL